MPRHLNRRGLAQGSIALAGLGLLAGCGLPPGPWAPPPRPRRIGVLQPGGGMTNTQVLDAFRQGLRDLGYVEGRDVMLELRQGEGREERFAELAAELVRLDVDVIVTAAGATRAAQQATATIPIVFATSSADPVEEGFVASLARPGGNATGLTLYAGQENAKRLQLLTEAFPGLTRVAVPWLQSGARVLQETQAAAQALGVELLPLELRSPDDLETVLDGAIAARADGIAITAGAVFSFLAPRIVAWVAAHRLPAIYAISTFVEAGGLLVYAASVTANWRRAAYYVDRILKGAKPADLPVERPTRFDFVINLKTAQALGLTITRDVLAQATEVVQ